MVSGLKDWEARLAAYLTEAATRPHAYGEHDCLLHVASAVEAVTGVDHGAEHRGRYSTEEEAKAYLRSLGFRMAKTLLDSLFTEKPVARAGRGDIVIDAEGIPGICIGGDALMVGAEPGREGFVRVPRAQWVRAWAV